MIKKKAASRIRLLKVALLHDKSGTIGVQKWHYCNVKGLVLNRRSWCVDFN